MMFRRVQTASVFWLLAAMFLPTLIHAQDALSDAEKKSTVENIDRMLRERYVFPEIAAKSADYVVKQFNDGQYENIVEREDFARQLTDDLQSINKDKHMRVRVREPRTVEQEDNDPLRARAHRNQEAIADNFGFYKVERLDGNVGYIDFRYFSGTPAARETAAAAMAFVSNCDALIFDMRKNGGGSPAMVQFICSYLFEQKTHLNSLYWRRGDVTEEFWTFDEIPGKKMPDVPAYVLTSSYTFSGAEEFSYNLQTQKRATLVGEVTGGGANPGGTIPVNEHYAIFIPTGRAINPVTQTNWEGTGVEPEIPTTAEEAFEKAYELARKAAQSYREARLAKLDRSLDHLRSELLKATEQFATGSAKKAAETVHQSLQAAAVAGLINEPSINQMGYQYLGEKNFLMAQQIFLYNVSAYPESFNVYDSLAESYMEDGKVDKAIRFYRKSLEINPENGNAIEMLAKMGVSWPIGENSSGQ